MSDSASENSSGTYTLTTFEPRSQVQVEEGYRYSTFWSGLAVRNSATTAS